MSGYLFHPSLFEPQSTQRENIHRDFKERPQSALRHFNKPQTTLRHREFLRFPSPQQANHAQSKQLFLPFALCAMLKYEQGLYRDS